MNWVLLLLFTIGESVAVASVCHWSVALTSNYKAIIMALGTTTCVVFGLTAWAIQSTRDFGDYLGYAMVAMIALVAASIINIFVKSTTLEVVGSAACAMVFGFYLLFDIQRLFKKEIDLTDPILISLSIYLDIVAMFIQILKLFTRAGSSDGD